MLQNIIIACLSSLLAASWLTFPKPPLRSASLNRLALSCLINVSVLGACLELANLRAAISVFELAIIFALLTKLVRLNLFMLRTADYPKQRRCY